MKKEFKDVLAKDFEIFKTGVWNGETFTEQDLDNMVKSYSEDDAPHIILGHSSDYKGQTLIPSFGRVKGMLKRIGNKLYACGTEFNELMAQWINEGFITQRSIELTKDNKRVLAIGMLGAMPPAVKGMPLMQSVLKESSLQFSELADVKSFEFAESDAIELTSLDEAEKLAIKDTIDNVAECVATFLKNVEDELNGDGDTDKLFSFVWSMQDELLSDLRLHADFVKKVEQIEEAKEEYSEKPKGFKEFVEMIKQKFNKRKETEVDAVKEKEYQDKIASLEASNKEFADKEFARQEQERIATEEKNRLEAERKDNELKDSIKLFCEEAIKSNKMTPAMREKDEPIMFTLAKTSEDALKSFQEKYVAGAVPLREVLPNEQTDNDASPQVIKKAKQYVKNHPKEFSGLSADDATNRAMFLQVQGKIKFEEK